MIEDKDQLQIDNWKIEHVFLDNSLTYSAPVIKGFIKGRRVETDVLLWFDLKKRIAMTKDKIFKIGEPNPQWMSIFIATGNSPEDLEIKDTIH